MFSERCESVSVHRLNPIRNYVRNVRRPPECTPWAGNTTGVLLRLFPNGPHCSTRFTGVTATSQCNVLKVWWICHSKDQAQTRKATDHFWQDDIQFHGRRRWMRRRMSVDQCRFQSFAAALQHCHCSARCACNHSQRHCNTVTAQLDVSAIILRGIATLSQLSSMCLQ